MNVNVLEVTGLYIEKIRLYECHHGLLVKKKVRYGGTPHLSVPKYYKNP